MRSARAGTLNDDHVRAALPAAKESRQEVTTSKRFRADARFAEQCFDGIDSPLRKTPEFNIDNPQILTHNDFPLVARAFPPTSLIRAWLLYELRAVPDHITDVQFVA
jgi:hypothetical protein